MKNREQLLWIVVTALVLGLGFAAFSSWSHKAAKMPHSRQLTADRTAVVVDQIRNMAALTTACFYEDKIVHEGKYRPQMRRQGRRGPSSSALHNILGLGPGREGVVTDSVETATLIFIAHSNVKAGFDLSGLTQDDIAICGDTLVVTLPPVRILDVVVNPSDWELYHRHGSWDYSEIQDVQRRAIEEIRGDAVRNSLLQQAEEAGCRRLESLLVSFGFPLVRVEAAPFFSVEKM